MKEVTTICPKCGERTMFKNYLDWILHTPFHWFGKRKTKCGNCGVHSYMKRVRNRAPRVKE